MMRRLMFFWICLWPIFLMWGNTPDYQEAPNVATTEGLPSNLVNQSVCVISGEYTDSVLDVVLPGPEPLIIQRNYGSQSNGGLGKSWSFNHRERLILGQATYEKEESTPVWVIGFRQPSGAQLDYIHPRSKETHKKKRLHFELLIPKGLTNGASHLSGKTNIKNQKVVLHSDIKKIISTSGSGSRSTFVPIDMTEDEDLLMWGKESEEKINGSVYIYECKAKDITKLSRIICQSKKTGRQYSHVKFEEESQSTEHPILALITSDSRKLKYHFKRHKYKVVERTKNTKNTTYIDSYYLTKVEHPYAPTETYEYEPKELSKELQLVCKKRPEGRFVSTEYYHQGANRVGTSIGIIHIDDEEDYRINRVKKQQAPVGTDDKPVTTHRFVYECKVKKDKKTGRKELGQGKTDVYDAYHHLQTYAYDKSHRLSSITRYKGTIDYFPYSEESFVWGVDAINEGNLLGKIFRDGQGFVHHARYFNYDAQGNVLTSMLCGKLTGLPAPDIFLNTSQYPIENGYECERKTYTYSDDGFNLILSETDSNGKTTNYDYLKGTDYLKSKFVSYEGQIQLREFYFYDDLGVLIKKITDDGKASSYQDLTGVTEWHCAYITPRQTAPYGLPATIEERYYDFAIGQEKILKSMNFYYSPQGKLLRQEVYDANRQLAYTLNWEYDDHGNVIREINALGYVIIKKYDANDNLIYQQGPSLDFYIQNTYDFANRLVSQEEIHLDGKRFATHHTYDYLGNCVATINPYGHETRQVFDDFGRVVEIHYPAVVNEEGQFVQPVTFKEYNLAGYPTCVTDPKGRKIQTEYNIRGLPTKIAYPDGAVEQFIYRVDGQLLQKIEKNGTRAVYERDALGRVINEAVYDLNGQILKQKKHLYNALHLLQTIDEEGCSTYYTYDAAGQLEWTRTGERVQQNLYDALGRIAEVREWFSDHPSDYRSTIKEYDLADRVIEERLQTSNGTILHLACYAYDVRGNRILEQIGDQKTWTEYDVHNNPVKITNALGHATHTIYHTNFKNAYGQKVLKAVTTDPLGYQTLHTYDAANRLVEIKRCNPFGLEVAHQAIFYDVCGNKCRISEAVMQDGKANRIIDTIFNYNEDNQLIALIEAANTSEQKVTRTHYNSCGQKSAVIKPDGNTLVYDYDLLGRVSILQSTDGSICYVYNYNGRNQVTRVWDLKSGQVTERAYDHLGQLVKENFGNGLSVQYQYDKTGRVRYIVLPDQTGIEYVYNAVDLKEVHRLIAGQRTYSHFDLCHNLSGQVTQVRLPGNNGEGRYHYNALGRCTMISSAQFQQVVPEQGGFDAAGNLLCYSLQNVPYTFTYDDHYQIKSESGHESHTYQCDSLCNRLVKDGELHTHNALNQVLARGQEQFIYDANGNLTCCMKGVERIAYAYDALDRLVSVTQNGKIITYSYDAFNRRLIKQQAGQEAELFIYQGQEEIGKWMRGSCQELRLLGKNKRSPMVALELRGTPYVPFQDMSGNVVCLLDHQGQVVERYRYTAFGESQILNSSGEILSTSAVGNPWQYAGKRLDEESGLVAFGLRYYEPGLGRWITPDPAGYADGSNLYAYVHNSPLLYYDQFGLFSLSDIIPMTNAPSFWLGYRDESKVKQIEFEKYLLSNVSPEEHLNSLSVADDILPPSYYIHPAGIYDLNRSGIINPKTNAPFNLRETPGLMYMPLNGIMNTFADFKTSLINFAELTNHNVVGVYSPSFGFFWDAIRYVAARFHIATETVKEIHKVWNQFFDSYPNGYVFCLPHSRGVVDLRNALMTYPPHLRERIFVIAIAPGCFVDEHLCREVFHLVCKGDPVPLFDLTGMLRCSNTIQFLDPVAGAPLHSVTSEVYKKPSMYLYENLYEKYK